MRGALQALELVSSQHVVERARLEGVLAERDAQLSAQAESHLAARRAAEAALAETNDRLRLAVEAGNRDTAQLQRELGALRQERDAAVTQGQALRIDAERAPVLERQLDDSQKENRLQFERAPHGMCRFSPEGTTTHVNRSLVRLLGYRTADELRKVDFATTVFESPDDMHWLFERCLSTRTTELVETTWRNKDRGRLVVRLQATATAQHSIELVAEDITTLRSLEEQLRRAQRMEAVARLAAEVAVTCDNLLRDATQDGRQWLAAMENDAPLRHQGEQLLSEVTRAAKLLGQLGVYGKEQAVALEPVTVNRVLLDLEGVLKRLAGDDIELILPKGDAHVEVDVDRERVERVLVNLASYARERMPSGGRLKIELATVTADSRFIAQYPNVRPGTHVLLTVTEVRGTVRPDGPTGLQSGTPATDAPRPPSDKPGVDFGALLGLIGECGGHLWMTTEPHGNMLLKIHLPARASSASSETPVPVTRPDRGKGMTRWFRH